MQKKKHGIISAASLCIGALLVAAPFPLFFIPNDIAPGGISGISTLIHAMTGWPVGVMSVVLNAPLFVISWRRMGKAFAVKSLAAMLISSAFIDILPFQPLTQDPMLAAIFGGTIMGVGLGLVIRAGATTGGTDMAAILVHERIPVISVGGILLMIDCLVIAASGFVFDIHSMLYALISMFLCSQVMDRVVEGFESAKAFFVFSEHTREIADGVMSQLERGATLLHAQGAFSGEERDVLLCVITRLQIPQFKAIVEDIDAEAFMMITDVREAMGEGFTREAKE